MHSSSCSSLRKYNESGVSLSSGNIQIQNFNNRFKFAQDDYPYLSIFRAALPKAAAIYSAPTTTNVYIDKIFMEHQTSSHETWIKAFVSELFRLFHDKHLNFVSSAHVMNIFKCVSSSVSLKLFFVYFCSFHLPNVFCRC